VDNRGDTTNEGASQAFRRFAGGGIQSVMEKLNKQSRRQKKITNKRFEEVLRRIPVQGIA
jgi:hypothetical protein